MKISLCIPQYNRIQYLLESLRIIEQQTYGNVEVVISDDCSTDDTEEQIRRLSESYRYPIVYKKNTTNLGYDRNYRQSIELAGGDYCFVLGNDDSFTEPGALQYLADFLAENNYPDIGFCNYQEFHDPTHVYKRATSTSVLGTGPETAFQFYSCFSFVGGLIYKREFFLKFNTDKYDGSVYTQMYIGSLMIARGCVLFSIEKPLVLKDILIGGQRPNNYRDTLARKWKDYKIVNAGLPSVMNVLINAFRDAGVLNQEMIYRIHKKIYAVTYPHWLLDYRSHRAFPEAVGLSQGLRPSKVMTTTLLSGWNKLRIHIVYFISTILGLILPVFLFNLVRVKLYAYMKKR